MNKFRRIIVLLSTVAILLAVLGCGGATGMKSPQLYGDRSEKTDSEKSKPKQEDAATVKTDQAGSETIADLPEKQEAPAEVSSKSEGESQGRTRNQTSQQPSGSVQTDILKSSRVDTRQFLSQSDIDDSASAVDDEIWRQFDLAEEYHAMGVIANREASWEEAQYYFEKALRILANLDVESDSVLTPEATTYNRLLDNLVADYRVTLRSLGNLVEDVSTSALVERFGDVAANLERDSMVVYTEEVPEITYDIPITLNERTKKSIVYFQTVARDAFAKYMRRSTKYKPMMLEILREYELPEDMIYLSMIESGFNPHAYSWARAMGLWQFISSTGRLYGLNRNWWMDERKDPVKATHAACTFLKELYEKFGSWELAWAAYNGGPGRVSRTIKKQGTRDFWKLRLRRQTMDYVPLIMAAAVIGKNPEKYGFTDIEYEDPIEWEEVTIDKCLELKVVAAEIGCSLQELKELNPELLRKYTPPNMKKYKLKIPVGKTKKFLAAYDDMPSPKETSWVRHKIRRGETVSTIAARYGVSQYAILEANNLSRRSTIYAGKQLIVPVPLDREYRGSSKKRTYEANNSIYVVRGGDTLWDIAKAFGTTVDALRRVNYVERGSRIYVGQKLRLPSSAKYVKEKESSSGKKFAIGSKSAGSRSTASDGPGTHKVRKGDTLWDIARLYGTSTASIRRLNGLGRSSRIYPGQVLRVNGSAAGTVYHKVRRGESLSRIARSYRTSMARIIEANKLSDPDQLRVGQTLKIEID